MKSICTALFALLLVMSGTATATEYPPTRTYEAQVQTVRLPDTANGTITVKECARCEYETYRVTARTVYALDGKNMRLDDFREAVERLRLDGEHNINVRRDLTSNTISKVFIYTQ